MDSPTQRDSRTSWQASKLAFASRILLGLTLISGGINNFLVRNPVSNPTPEADRFLTFLNETGYMLQAVAITEITVGILLLSGRFIPLAGCGKSPSAGAKRIGRSSWVLARRPRMGVRISSARFRSRPESWE